MKIFLTYILALSTSMTAGAAVAHDTIPAGAITSCTVERSTSGLIVDMDIHPAVFKTGSNREFVLYPAVVAGSDTLRMNPVVVAGRTRYYQHRRTGGLPTGSVLLRSGSQEVYQYHSTLPWIPEMEESQLVLTSDVDGCCGGQLGRLAPVALDTMDYRARTLNPVMVYVQPIREIDKTRTVKKQAFVDYPVGKTEIYPDYRNNPAELAEILRTIDAVRKDEDVTIKAISIIGYASPEGAYSVNERLAKGRTESLTRYVKSKCNFPDSLLNTFWVAEDWVGLAEAVRKLDWPDKDEILAVITDTDLEPDQREIWLKDDYPERYAWLLANVYPAMRHSDYDITYKVRDFSDVAEIAAIMSTAPQKLSLEELFLYAKSLDKDSPEFREVMEVAVRMFPNDPEANLNAAVTAVSAGDYSRAREYLRKAGDSPVATYTRGVMEAKEKNYSAAVALLEKAAGEGVAEAEALLAEMRRYGMIDR